MDILEQTKTQTGKEILFLEEKGVSDKPKNILFIGVTHGEEPQGKFLTEKFMKEIEEKNLSFQNNLFFIPCLNPDGFEKKQRGNSNNVDLNRNFKTKNWIKTTFDDGTTSGEYPFSEKESLFLGEIVDKYNFDVILSLHAPFKIVNFDGNAKTIAEKISEIINYPVEESIGYPTPGSFGTFAGVERNIPTITLELSEDDSIETLYKSCQKIFLYLANEIM